MEWLLQLLIDFQFGQGLVRNACPCFTQHHLGQPGRAGGSTAHSVVLYHVAVK